jgi:hypothetical protein
MRPAELQYCRTALSLILHLMILDVACPIFERPCLTESRSFVQPTKGVGACTAINSGACAGEGGRMGGDSGVGAGGVQCHRSVRGSCLLQGRCSLVSVCLV